MNKYWHVWWTSAKLSISTQLVSRGASSVFVIGKLFRFASFVYFLFILGGNVKEVAGYSFTSLLTFFLIFNLFDIFGQLFFRGIYWFRQQVITGEFDFRLVKPISPLFQALTRQTDVLDLPILLVVIVALIRLGVSWTPMEMIVFILASIAGVILSTSIHIFVAALGVLTTEVDHTMWIYRDLSLMARFPIDIYTDFLRALLTFVLPVGIIFTFPAKAFMGILGINNLLIAIVMAGVFYYLSILFWRYSLTKYSSASS
jgi:ABC-2 type transport system permease protein